MGSGDPPVPEARPPAEHDESDFTIEAAAYEWTARAIGAVGRILPLHIHLHGDESLLETGEIFLFNHFARFETFIPQYLIFRRTGAQCRSVAAGELFRGADAVSRYLRRVGAVPSDWDGLLAFLAAEVLRGRKVLVFPEGGMVKDRRILDAAGRYRVYSRSARERRKHHTGAAVLGLVVEAFKGAVRRAGDRGDGERLAAWAAALGLDDARGLLARARAPTRIVPGNITFYPIRISENLLRRGAELLAKGLRPRIREELLIEGNLLLRDTDMDIRLADPLDVGEFLPWWDRWAAERAARRAQRPGDLLDGRGLWPRRLRHHALRLRDRYMVAVYAAMTVNLSHLASRIVLQALESGLTSLGAELFHRMVYLAVKGVQQGPGLHLHRSLVNPEEYWGLVSAGECPGLEQLVETARQAELLERTGGEYRFLGKLREEHGIDEIRVENPLAVYANEVAPLAGVRQAVEGAFRDAPSVAPARLARLRFDDEVRSYEWDLARFRRPEHEEVNRDEGEKRPGVPFLLLPRRPRDLGVLLVHGFSASPAELRPFAERLVSTSYAALGVRLKGHGTSPWDLMERSWEDWFASVRRGYGIMRGLAERVAVVGFSAGGCLALRLAAERPEGLAGIAAVAAPVKVRDRGMRLVPLVHGANRLVGSLGGRRLMTFHHTEPEHPDINYRHVPVRALYELGRLIDATREALGEVRCPVLLVQGTEDPTVDPESADILYKGLGVKDKALVLIPSPRHGILLENVGGTQERVLRFLEGLGG